MASALGNEAAWRRGFDMGIYGSGDFLASDESRSAPFCFAADADCISLSGLAGEGSASGHGNVGRSVQSCPVTRT